MGWENCVWQSMLAPLCSVFVLHLSSPFCHACLCWRPHKYKQACLLIFLCLLIIRGGGHSFPLCRCAGFFSNVDVKKWVHGDTKR